MMRTIEPSSSSSYVTKRRSAIVRPPKGRGDPASRSKVVRRTTSCTSSAVVRPGPGGLGDDLENRRGRGHHAVLVALVVEGQPDANLAAGALDRFPVDAEGPGLPAGEEHDVPGLHLEQPRAPQLRPDHHPAGPT